MKSNRIKMLCASIFIAGSMGCAMSSPVKNIGSFDGLANSNPNKGSIFVYRDKAFAGVLNQYDVMINGKLAGSLPDGSFFAVETDPGEIKIEPDTFTKFGLGKGTSITVEKGKSYCLKLTLNFCVQCKSADINLVDNEQCENEIRSLAKVRLE